MNIQDVWKLLAGLGIFIFAMSILESALKQLAGRTFKIFLRKHTENRLEASLSGTIVTAVLQSSSVVSMMVLGFVGAGILNMRNALAVVFGSNLGTTLDGWVVAILGFKYKAETFSFPLIAAAGIALVAFQKRNILLQWSRFIMGFGMLFLGLMLMKESAETLVKHFDIGAYAHVNRLGFLALGFLITAIIQSSSATVVITLTALHSKAIPFEAAVAIVTGAELGSSIKLLYASLGGLAAKRCVAVGNIIFNITVTTMGYILMTPLIWFVLSIVGEKEQLIALVLFQTCINLLGLLIFLPMLNPLSNFLEKRFTKTENPATGFINEASVGVPELTLATMEKETDFFIHRVVNLTQETFHLKNAPFKTQSEFKKIIEEQEGKHKTFNEKYEHIKKAEGEILQLYIRQQEHKIPVENMSRLTHLVAAVRNAMYSLKGIKDIEHNRTELRESADDVHYEQYLALKDRLTDFYEKLETAGSKKNQQEQYKALVNLVEYMRKDYDKHTNEIYSNASAGKLTELEISTLLNVNREIYSSCKAIIFAMKDYLLDAKDAGAFEELPVSV